jgi:hypothetical protein
MTKRRRHIFFCIVVVIILCIATQLHVRNSITTTSTGVRQRSSQPQHQVTIEEVNEDDDVDDIYPKLLAKAKHQSLQDSHVYQIHGQRGVVIGPVGGKFVQTLKALRNARRTRNILNGYDNNSDIKLALVTSMEHKLILEQYCTYNTTTTTITTATDNLLKNVTTKQIIEACQLYSNGTLLDNIIETWPNPPYTNESHNRGKEQGSSQWQMMSLGGPFRAPYQQTLFLDSDAYTCPGFTKLFDILLPYSNKHWTAPSFAPANLAIGLEQYTNNNLRYQIPWYRFIPTKYNRGNGTLYTDLNYFSMRNTGVHIWNFQLNEHTHIFAHFLVLVAEHLYNNIATVDYGVTNDQDPFRLALYIYQQLVPEFHEVNFPQHTSCRTYPNYTYAGIDGARNGMYPIQPDGTICSDCQCTPCLIAHNTGVLFVTVNGKKGWEDDKKIYNGSNSLS